MSLSDKQAEQNNAMTPYRISLICTARDEADNIAVLLDSMLAQTRQPDEIVINDNLSRDTTPTIVQEYAQRYPQIRLVSGGFNIPSGRNNAIRHASGNLIACTDAGLKLAPDWLEQIIAPLEHNEADLVGGFFTPAPQSTFELALGATNYRNVDEIRPQRFLPFGKSMAFRKAVWEQVGGFPEWASHCEDLVFNLAVEKAGFRRAFAPGAIVFFRPRESLRAFARQYFFYARGDGIAGLWTGRHILRYGVYGGLVALLGLMFAAPRLRVPGLAAILAWLALYTRAPYRRLWAPSAALNPAERMYALSLPPIVRIVGDIAKMIGYPVGLWKRKNVKRKT